jgi:hypothetical protein
MLLGSVVKNYRYEQEILDDVTHIPSFMKIHEVFEQLEVDRLTHTHTQARARAHAHAQAHTRTEHDGLET